MAFPPDTTYAATSDFTSRFSGAAGADTTVLQSYLNAAARIVDGLTRQAKEGYEAFSASASEARVFDDDLTDSIEIDDALTITQVQRGTVAINAVYYKTWPYNPGKGPITKIMFRLDALINATQVATSLWYGHPHRGVGAGMITVTGTWGYCDASQAGARPAVIKEATLAIAKQLFDEGAYTAKDMMQAVQNPSAWVDKKVYNMLSGARLIKAESGAGLFV